MFHRIDNDYILAYSKRTSDLRNVIITVVNLDPHGDQHGLVALPLSELGLPADEPYQVQDLLTGALYTWRGSWNYVELNPQYQNAHILRVERGPESAHG